MVTFGPFCLRFGGVHKASRPCRVGTALLLGVGGYVGGFGKTKRNETEVAVHDAADADTKDTGRHFAYHEEQADNNSANGTVKCRVMQIPLPLHLSHYHHHRHQ